MLVDIQEKEEEMSFPDFWDDQQKAQQTIDELNVMKNQYEPYIQFEEEIEEAKILFEMIEETEDEELAKELQQLLNRMEEEIDQFELLILLNDPYDKNNAILEL